MRRVSLHQTDANMKRVMSESNIFRIAEQYGITGTRAAILAFTKYMLKEGSDADLMKMVYKEPKEKK